MIEWLSFDAVIEPLVWGDATHTILRIPANVETALREVGAKRVEGEVNDHPVNLAVIRAEPVTGAFLWAGQSLLARIGVLQGERVEIRLRPAADDAVETPDDISFALRMADQTDLWERLTPGKRRGLIYQINTAKTEATRTKRINSLLDSLR